MQTVILAGGLGTRLRPITEQIPKPMVEVNGRPFLEYILRHMAGQGFDRVLLLVGYLGDQVRKHFGDGRQFGVSIDYSFESSPLGTGGAIREAFAKLDDTFLVLYGDSFLPIDYRSVSEAFSRSAADGLLVLYDNRNGDTSVPNNIALDSEGYVSRYEKGRDGRGLDLVDAGALCLRRCIFAGLHPGRVISLEQQLFPDLVAKRQLAGYITDQRFFDIGTPARLEEFAAYERCGTVV